MEKKLSNVDNLFRLDPSLVAKLKQILIPK